MAEAAGSDDEELAVAELAAYCESREERAMRKAKEAKSSKADSTSSIDNETLAVEVHAQLFSFFLSTLMRAKRCCS